MPYGMRRRRWGKIRDEGDEVIKWLRGYVVTWVRGQVVTWLSGYVVTCEL